MRDLTIQLVTRFTNKTDNDNVKVVWIQSQEVAIIEKIEDSKNKSHINATLQKNSNQIKVSNLNKNKETDIILKNALLINLSNNKLDGKTLHLLWNMFPSSWW